MKHSPEDNQRILRSLVYELLKPTPRPERYLALVAPLLAICDGADANIALGLKRQPGKLELAEIKRRRWSLILHWTICACDPETGLLDENGDPITRIEACRQAQDTIVPLAREVFPLPDGEPDETDYGPEVMSKKFTEYPHLNDRVRGFYDADFPY